MEARIAVIDPVGIKSGMNHYNNSLCLSLCRMNIVPFIYSNYQAPSKKIQSRAFFGTFFSSKMAQAFNFLRGMFFACLDCRKNKINIAIVHVFSTHHMAFLTYLMLKITGLKVITISHDVSSFTKQDNSFYHSLIYNVWSKYIVVHNEFSKSHLLPQLSKYSQSKVRVIKHGAFLDLVDHSITHSFARNSLGLHSKCQYLLFFGRVKPTKRLDVLLDAMPYINPNIHLIIAGKSIKNNFDSYQQKIDNLNIAHRIILDINYITDEKREWYFKASDVMILPYEVIYQSGVLLMSMSYGLPVVASRIPPFEEVVEDKKNGILFESLNPADLAKKVNNLMANQEMLSSMSIASKLRMQKDFSWDEIAQKYHQLISSI